ncbi:MAG: sugar isomerase domain-containing protein, partial [Chloroflexi bacterium]
YALESRDCLIVISNSGRNASPIEMAMLGRERGLPVIAVTAAEFSRSVSSRHSSGKRLLDLAHVVLDTCGAAGDAAVELEGVMEGVGPTSTVVGATLLNSTLVETIAELVRRGVEPPVLVSQNVDGSAERNTRLRDRYRGRIRSVT